MIFGISGASGTGKSTLAKAVAEELGYEFVPASITELARQCGYEAVSELSMSERIAMQAKLLTALIDKIKGLDHRKPYIMDRTPLDTIGYLMGELPMHSHNYATPEELESASKLATTAQVATAGYVTRVFITAPLPVYEQAETRPAINPAYQKHVHFIITGATISSPRTIDWSLLMTTDFEERKRFVCDDIAQRMSVLHDLHTSAKHIH